MAQKTYQTSTYETDHNMRRHEAGQQENRTMFSGASLYLVNYIVYLVNIVNGDVTRDVSKR